MSLMLYLKRLHRYLRFGIPVVTANITTLEGARQLEHKRGIITGGSKGIGFAIAKKCISEGAEVVITGRNPEDLAAARAQLGEKCRTLAWDVSEIGSHRDRLLECCRLLGDQPIDFLVNNAGVSFHEGTIRDVTPEGFEQQFRTNLEGPYFLTQAFIERQRETKKPDSSILFVSSERGLMGDDIPYGLTKAAVNSLVKGLARRLLDEHIRVNGVAPGVTVSNMVHAGDPDKLYRSKSVGKRFFLPEEVAEVACFLLSDRAGCITGEIVACDQGNYQRNR